MATVPFGALLEAAIKLDRQGGVLTVLKDRIVAPRFFCCTLDTDGMDIIGVAKDPVAVLIVNPTRVCAGDNVNVDFSHSWSSTSTLTSWVIDWGDGNSSNGVFPGPPWAVNHPDGGYAIPATYTITLTVTDLLGATGEDTQQVEVIDCAAGPPLGLFAGCGSSGVWYSEDAGIGWEARGLEGVEIYDLKVHPFSLGLEENELWAATVNGLYRSVDSGGSWTRIHLPEPETGLGEPLAVAVCPSKVLREECYVLAQLANQAWLYRTVDSGESWNATQNPVGGCNPIPIGRKTWVTMGAGGMNGTVYSMVTDGVSVYACGAFTTAGGVAALRVARWDGTGWHAMGAGFANDMYDLSIDRDGILWISGGKAGGLITVAWWDGAAWHELPAGCPETNQDGVAHGVSPVDGHVFMATMNTVFPVTPGACEMAEWDGAGWSAICDLGVNVSGPLTVTVDWDGAVWFGGAWSIAPATDYLRVSSHGCTCPGGQPNSAVARLYTDLDTRHVYAIGGFGEIGSVAAYRIARYNGADWNSIGQIPMSAGHTLWGLYVGSKDFILVGTGIVAGVASVWKWDGVVWTQMAGRFDTTSYVTAVCQLGEITYAGGSFTDIDGNVVNRAAMSAIEAGFHLSTEGRFHSLDMSADGRYVYVAGLDAANRPIVLRVYYTLEDFDVIVDEGAPGTWAGVKADYTQGGRVWVFGNLSNTWKVRVSDDYGGTEFLGNGDDSWANNEVVRAVLPSIYDSEDIVAILNVALEAWRSGDGTTSWAKTGDLVFSCHCGERDWIEDMNIFVGRLNAVATHLQYSPNLGAGWIERSGGIVPNDAPITALQIVS